MAVPNGKEKSRPRTTVMPTISAKMSPSLRARTFPSGFPKNCALLLVLFAPSIWMITNIPPLWRDSDAHIQLTVDPLVSTFWGHAPAYSYVAKIPIFLGEQWERWRGITISSPAPGVSPLTDTGVGLLIVFQHLALGGAAFYFIVAISQFFWIRLALAAVWASNALFYTFAHCVGSETLSMILVVLVVAKGWRLIRRPSEPRWIDWYIFAVALCLCLLTRHANIFLIFLLPAAFLFSSAQGTASQNFHRAVIAIAIGLACFTVANSLTHRLSRKTRLHPHSRIGFTFLWRLDFLRSLPPPARVALLQKVAARTDSAETRKLLALLGEMHEEGAEVSGGPFMRRAAPLLYPSEAVVPWEKLDLALNQMAFAFLLPPTPEHLDVAKTEFAAALKMSETEIIDQLFETTAYFFDHREDMPACAGLVTFRNTTADTIGQISSQHAYFHLWQGVSYHKAFLIWFGTLLVFIAGTRRSRVSAATMCAFGITLVVSGLFMTASACLIVVFLPRYGFPMWELLLLSFSIFAGSAADLFATTGFRRSMQPEISKEKSARQLPGLG